MKNRVCPACEQPAVSLWQLIWLGGARRADCVSCGAKISVSALSYFVILTVGTWIPVAGAIFGAIVLQALIGNSDLIGGVAGFLITTTLFALLYFRWASLVRA